MRGPVRRIAPRRLAYAAVLAATPLAAQPADSLQVADATVQTAGFRLATGNAAFCTAQRPMVGLLLQDLGNYKDPALARRVLGLSRDIAVEAVAKGSPAEAAGLAANMGLLALDGQDLTALPPVKAGSWQRLDALADALEQGLAARGVVDLTAERGGAAVPLTLQGVSACAARFELATSGRAAEASEGRVVIARRMVDELGGDEALVAAVLAHELAHLVLDQKARRVPARAGEDEADRLSVWLLQNAGYDPESAVSVQLGWGRDNDKGIFSATDHSRWKTRAALTTAEIAVMRRFVGADGQADWQTHFRRWQKD